MGWGGTGRLFEFDWEGRWIGGGRLLTFFVFRMGFLLWEKGSGKQVGWSFRFRVL